MATNSTIDNSQPTNPFKSQGEYSPEAVELMRALSEQRKRSGQASSTPAQVLETVRELGYAQPIEKPLYGAEEATRFVKAMSAYQQQHELPYPTCEDLLSVLKSIGYARASAEKLTVTDGLAIDRRRREEDERLKKLERRSSLEPSLQEQMELTDEEHAFLDALKTLREESGREFASSEELLSIIWNLGYRMASDDGFPIDWLSDEDRCRVQIAFTSSVEQKISQSTDSDFLTCRSLLEIVNEIGFRKF